MKSIKDRLSEVLNQLPQDCTLVAVSKTKPAEQVMEAYNAGHRDFGENKVQELVSKSEALPKDIRWHMIGHLQRNKVKYLAPFVHLIHGVDSLRLLEEIDKQGKKHQRKIHCLLQVHIAAEETKFGFAPDELKELLTGDRIAPLTYVNIDGIMAMASHTTDLHQVAQEFKALNDLYCWCKDMPSMENIDMTTLSSGMSGDYTIALQYGSNMIRIGSAIFGKRTL